MQQDELPWANYDEAMSQVKAYGDVALEQFVMRAVTIVINRFSAGVFPAEKLDMLYFVEILRELFQQRETLARIFSGEDLRWFNDDA